MKHKSNNHIRGLILPCIGFSVLTGAFSAVIITAFKVVAEWVVHFSASIYNTVRANPTWLPVLIIGAALIGLLASLVLTVSNSCKGGGIPTSVAAIRGIFSFRWISGIIFLPISALLTFLAGLPLGTEGPCVQMGTAVGDGVIKCLGKDKHKGWRRYIMTGGASAGFSIATASPISAVIFAIEELHKNFSPLLLSAVSISVIVAQIISRALAAIGIGDTVFFHIPRIDAIPLSLIFAPILLGLVSGLCSTLFTKQYHHIDRMMRKILGKCSEKILLPLLFATVSVVGFFFADTLSSGHSLIDSLFTPGAAWYMLILLFILRAVGMMICNTSGATGGVFLPTLAFGAIIGAIFADLMLALGWIGEEHYLMIVVLGITSFLGATSRIPLTACVFAVEALGGINNLLPIIIATTVAYLSVEASGIEDLTDKIIEAKLHKITGGKEAFSVESTLTVKKDAFVIGKDMRDILWPNSCVVVAYNRINHTATHSFIYEGDMITVRYQTHDVVATKNELNDLVGEQD